MPINERLPDMYDDVKHKKSEATGTIIAMYQKLVRVKDKDGNIKPDPQLRDFVDVRSSDDTKIYYASPLENWEFVRSEKDRNE